MLEVGLLAVGVLVILLTLGVPLPYCFGGGLMVMYFIGGATMKGNMLWGFQQLSNPVLLAIPLFTFAGYLLGEGKASTRLVNVTDELLGWLPGGLAVISLLVCAAFTAFTGASGVTIFALGGLLLPAMLKDGYSERFSMGLITSSGSLGLLFPPSLPLILYGVIAETRIDHLFLAGIIPGFLMLILLSVYAVRSGVVHTREELAGQHPLKILKETAWELPLPFIIIIGIYGGFLVAGEAAAVTALYVLVVEVFIYRDIKISQIPKIMGRSMTLFGGILVILRIVDDARLEELLAAASEASLFVLLEAFDAGDLDRSGSAAERARALGVRALVGLNSRDLESLEVDRERLRRLADRFPPDVPRVAESGLLDPTDAARVAAWGYQLGLVGTALMRQRDPGAAVAAMIAAGRAARELARIGEYGGNGLDSTSTHARGS